MDAINQAKAVIRSHEECVAASDLEGVMGNMAEDVVMLAPGSPLIQGRDSVRAFYEGLLSMGHSEFTHDYDGAEEVGDLVILHGVARGSLTPREGTPDHFANNFILTLKRDETGRYLAWRGAFAPGAE